MYYAISDQEEDACVQHLSDWRKANAEDKSLPGKTVGIHLGKYVQALKTWWAAFPTGRLIQKVSGRPDFFRYPSPLLVVYSPPPEPVLS